MKLRDLHIEGFGHFHDFSLGPLDSNLAVVYGPNEAGKSTLLAFIRTILFGLSPLEGVTNTSHRCPEGDTGGASRLKMTRARAIRSNALPVPAAAGISC